MVTKTMAIYTQGKVCVLKFSGAAENRIGSNLEATGLTMVLIGPTPSVMGVIDTEALFEAPVKFSPKSALTKETFMETKATNIAVKANINIFFIFFPPKIKNILIIHIYFMASICP
jgi:hypothetical protein